MTLEQTIAKKALDQVKSVRSNGETPSSDELEYRAQIEGLPAMLRSCGLSRTLAFLKGRSAIQKRIASDLEAQFRNTGLLSESKDLQQLLAACTLREYRVYARVGMLIALWNKRLAQALLRRREKSA